MSLPTAIYPEVPGELGPATEYDYSSTPHEVRRAAPLFNTWLGDDLLEMFPIFLVTERLKRAIEEAALGGVRFESVEVERSPTFYDLYGALDLPTFYRMIPGGGEGSEDFAVSPGGGDHLVVSERALALLRQFRIQHAELRR